MNQYRLRAYTYILIATVIWGIGGPVIKFTLEGFPPFIFLGYRLTISALIGLLFTLIAGLKITRSPKIIGLTLLNGFLITTVALGLLFLGFDKTSVANAVLIGATGPIFVTIAGSIFLKEHITRQEQIGIGIAFAGTIITLVEPLLKNHDGINAATGNMLVLASTLIAIPQAILAKFILRDHVQPTTATSVTFFTGFITLVPFVLLWYSPATVFQHIASAPFAYHLGVLFMAILSGNLAYFLWYNAEKSIEVGEVSIFSYLIPLISIPIAVLWLNETITIPFIIGACIIAVGVFIAEFKKYRVKLHVIKTQPA